VLTEIDVNFQNKLSKKLREREANWNKICLIWGLWKRSLSRKCEVEKITQRRIGHGSFRMDEKMGQPETKE
jgi:hypothetical protein